LIYQRVRFRNATFTSITFANASMRVYAFVTLIQFFPCIFFNW